MHAIGQIGVPNGDMRHVHPVGRGVNDVQLVSVIYCFNRGRVIQRRDVDPEGTQYRGFSTIANLEGEGIVVLATSQCFRLITIVLITEPAAVNVFLGEGRTYAQGFASEHQRALAGHGKN